MPVYNEFRPSNFTYHPANEHGRDARRVLEYQKLEFGYSKKDEKHKKYLVYDFNKGSQYEKNTRESLTYVVYGI